MKSLASFLSRFKSGKSAGFTMIELLIVITILGILAVAVLSAINPVEQINRGRDTGTRSDAEQLLSAIDRFNAFKGYFPWMYGANDTSLALVDSSGTKPVEINATTPWIHASGGGNSTTCRMLDMLSGGSTTVAYPLGSTGCTAGSDELKSSFISRVSNPASSRQLYIYNHGDQGDSTYVCFIPQSNAFRTEAEVRCKGSGATYDLALGMPSDVPSPASTFLCGGVGAPVATKAMVCLP